MATKRKTKMAKPAERQFAPGSVQHIISCSGKPADGVLGALSEASRTAGAARQNLSDIMMAGYRNGGRVNLESVHVIAVALRAIEDMTFDALDRLVQGGKCRRYEPWADLSREQWNAGDAS